MKILITLLALCFSSILLATPLKNIVAFGDSLSDNGNLYEYMKHRIPISPPYYEGRFTNGPIWVELLATHYFSSNASERLLDYAFGGAAVADEADEADEDALFTLQHEVEVYLLAHDNKADPDSLFTVWMGANNYLAVPEDVNHTIEMVTSGIERSLIRLAEKGAKNILVINLPDLGRTPVAREFSIEEELNYYVKEHNQILNKMVISLQKKYPDITWIYYDVNKDMREIMDFPEESGFSNVFDTCYDEIVEKPSHTLVIELASKAKFINHHACDGFLYFDPVHPTAPAHKMIAEKVQNILSSLNIEFIN